jgi:hypothetical protein
MFSAVAAIFFTDELRPGCAACGLCALLHCHCRARCQRHANTFSAALTRYFVADTCFYCHADACPLQRHTGAEPNTAPALGTALGSAAKLSQSELEALRARLMALWNPPVGIQNPEEFVIRIRIRLNRDGRLSAPPSVLSSGHGVLFTTARDSAVRAVFRGQPFDMLRPEHYETWKDIEVTFDPRDMFRG